MKNKKETISISSSESKPLVPVQSSVYSHKLPQYPWVCLSNLSSIVHHLLSLSNIVQYPSTLLPTTILNVQTLSNPPNISSNYLEPLREHFKQLRNHLNNFRHHLHYLGLLWWYLVPSRNLPLTHVIPSRPSMEGCLVWQPTLNLRWTRKTGSNYLCCMKVGTISYYKWGKGKLLYLHCMKVGTKVRE